MKIKHQALIATAIALSLVALAFALYTPKVQAFEGYHVGASFGGVLAPVNHLGDKLTDFVITGVGTQLKDEWAMARKPSLNFSLKAGYGKLFDKMYCGFEGSVNKSRYRMKIVKSTKEFGLDSHDELRLNLRDVDYAIDYKHGYLISPETLLFAKVGVARNRARLSLVSNTVIKFPANNEQYNHPGYLKNEKTIYPVRFGFGVEHKFIKDLAVTCDYTYTRRLRSLNLKGTTSSASPVGQVTSTRNDKMTIQSTSVMLGLKYYFLI